jgi:hypothetical protein
MKAAPLDVPAVEPRCTEPRPRVGHSWLERLARALVRGHDADRGRAILAGQKRGLTPTIRRERRRRNAIEPVIGHMKSDGHLGRNFLLGTQGDATNLILTAAGHNLRLLRAWLAWLLALLFSLGAPTDLVGRSRKGDRRIA